jgi:hypothetical protein
MRGLCLTNNSLSYLLLIDRISGLSLPSKEEMSLPPETENTLDRRSGRRDATSGVGLVEILYDRRVIWLLLAAAAIHSVVPAKMLMADWGGGMVPGIAVLIVTGIAIVWLVVVWGLVAMAGICRSWGVRAVVLVLLLLPYPFEISMLAQGIAAVSHLRDDPKTGRGFFDGQTDRELGAAIWTCDWRNRNEGVACDLDKIAALTARTDTSKVSSDGMSLMWWAISNGANPDVLRIVLRGGKPPADVSSWLLDRACCDSGDLPLLRGARRRRGPECTITRRQPLFVQYLPLASGTDGIPRRGRSDRRTGPRRLCSLDASPRLASVRGGGVADRSGRGGGSGRTGWKDYGCAHRRDPAGRCRDTADGRPRARGSPPTAVAADASIQARTGGVQ